MLRIFIHCRSLPSLCLPSFTIIGCLFRLNLFRSHSHRKSHCNHASDSLGGENPEVLWSPLSSSPAVGLLLSFRSIEKHDGAMMFEAKCLENVRLAFPFRRKNKTALFRGSRMLTITCNRLDTIVLIIVIILMRRDLHMLIDCNNGAWSQIKSKRLLSPLKPVKDFTID